MSYEFNLLIEAIVSSTVYVLVNTAGLGVPTPLQNLDAYKSLHAGFPVASPSAVFVAAAAAAAAAALKSTSSSSLDQQELCRQALPPVDEKYSVQSSTTVAPTVTAAGGLMTSLCLPLLSSGHHPFLPTLGFTLEQVTAYIVIVFFGGHHYGFRFLISLHVTCYHLLFTFKSSRKFKSVWNLYVLVRETLAVHFAVNRSKSQ